MVPLETVGFHQQRVRFTGAPLPGARWRAHALWYVQFSKVDERKDSVDVARLQRNMEIDLKLLHLSSLLSECRRMVQARCLFHGFQQQRRNDPSVRHIRPSLDAYAREEHQARHAFSDV